VIAVIFEVWPKPEYRDNYLELAAELRKSLETIDGFISVERFQSIVNEDKMVSLSFFDNHRALDEWRNVTGHRAAQKLGRSKYFADYRLRIANVERDYSMNSREEVPEDSRVSNI